jgi:hypothetical protein
MKQLIYKDNYIPIIDTNKLYVMEVHINNNTITKFYICIEDRSGKARFVENSDKLYRTMGCIFPTMQDCITSALIPNKFSAIMPITIYEFDNVQEFEKNFSTKLSKELICYFLVQSRFLSKQ